MWKYLKTNLKNNLLSGLIVVVPLVISLIVLKWLIDFFDSLIRPIAQSYINIYIPGMGIIISFIFIYLIGLLTKNFFGNKFVQIGEWIVVRIPIAKTVYVAVKQVMTTITLQKEQKTQKVVLVEYPRRGIYSVGFYNGQIEDVKTGKMLGSVLIITSINPASGFTILVPISEIRFIDMPVEQAMKLIISGGIVLPKKFEKLSS